ncbi:MAG: hypothetical protein AAFZ15_21685, partial [Bacteroidota bacterium]
FLNLETPYVPLCTDFKTTAPSDPSSARRCGAATWAAAIHRAVPMFINQYTKAHRVFLNSKNNLKK